MRQAERDYLVRTITYFDGCIQAYDMLFSRADNEQFSVDDELRQAAERCRAECVRWRDELDAKLKAR